MRRCVKQQIGFGILISQWKGGLQHVPTYTTSKEDWKPFGHTISRHPLSNYTVVHAV